MRLFGLIGYPLSHSFSKRYFAEKFEKEGIEDAKYELFEIESIDKLPEVLNSNQSLQGLNVTIPFKQKIFDYLDDIDFYAKEIGAVNVVKITDGKLKGYNSDFYGFKVSLEQFLGANQDYTQMGALVLGSGGASKAVAAALKALGISYSIVSREKSRANFVTYKELEVEILAANKLIINTTPLGMYPKIDTAPPIPYEFLTANHYLYDLVYNPEYTQFMQKGVLVGAKVINGMPMLILQAEKSWDIWNENK